jgi:8-oxo-dGTP pyrophosphatase MutT (NUDIX family)
MNKLLQAGAVPYRTSGSRVEFLLITSQRGNWIFPKGIVEPGESTQLTALKEAHEEAGVLGRIVPHPLGSYGDRKWRSDCEVEMFLLEYSSDSASWEEGAIRARRWCTYHEALDLIKKPEVREILRLAQERLSGVSGPPDEARDEAAGHAAPGPM